MFRRTATLNPKQQIPTLKPNFNPYLKLHVGLRVCVCVCVLGIGLWLRVLEIGFRVSGFRRSGC